MPIIQAVMISGSFVESAKWEVESLSDLKEGHQVQVSIPLKDQHVLDYMTKEGMPKKDCYLEKDGKAHSLVLSLQVSGFRHMLDGSGLQSMVLATPMNRTVEAILTYLFSKEQCDPRFVSLLTGQPRTKAV